MLKLTEFSHQLLTEHLKSGNIAIDATCGNGFDSVFLSKLVGPNGRVIAYDIQEEAIAATKKLAEKEGCRNISYKLQSHEFIDEDRIDGVIFNLGYLPGGDKSITTKASSTLKALQNLIEKFKENPSLLIVLVVYPGHDEGRKESTVLNEYLTKIDPSILVSKYTHLNQRMSPYVISIQQKRG